MGVLGQLLGGLGGAIGSAAGSGDDPKYNRAKLDPRGQVAVDSINSRAAQTPGQFTTANLEGVDTESKGILPGAQASSQRDMTALGMSGASAQSQAINNKIGQKYASDLAKVKRQAGIQGITQSLQAKDTAEQLGDQQVQMERSQDLIEKQQFAEAEANRNAVFSQIFTGVGGFAVNAAFDINRMVNQAQTPAGQQSASQQSQQKSIDNSLFGKQLQGLFKGGE